MVGGLCGGWVSLSLISRAPCAAGSVWVWLWCVWLGGTQNPLVDDGFGTLLGPEETPVGGCVLWWWPLVALSSNALVCGGGGGVVGRLCGGVLSVA